MDIVDLALVATRRWYATIPALVLVGLTAVWTGDAVSPECTSTASISVLPPLTTGSTDHPKNPWVIYGAHELASAVRLTLDGPAYRNRYTDSGLDGKYEVIFEWGSPILQYKSTSTSCDEAIGTTNKLVEDTQTVVARQQDGYSLTKDEMIRVQVLGDGTAVTTSGANIRKAQIAVGAAALLILAVVIVALDGVLVRRKKRLNQLTVADGAAPPLDDKPRAGRRNPALINVLEWKSSAPANGQPQGPLAPEERKPQNDDTLILPLSTVTSRTERK